MTSADTRPPLATPLLATPLLATLVFLLDGEPPGRLLLGRKKRGFGEGKLNGIGGKVEPGESVRTAAVRELSEEIGVRCSQEDLDEVAHLDFTFTARPEWDMQVRVYLLRCWGGTPVETDEIRPVWTPCNALPFDEMWADDRIWLPRVLAGERLDGQFHFGPDGETVVDHVLNPR